MTNPLDRLEDGFPHGTIQGEGRGCTASDCPARPMRCRDVARRYKQDLTFRRLYDAGLRGDDLVDGLAIASGLDPDLVSSTSPAVAQARRPRSPLPKSSVPATVSPGYRVVPIEMWALVDDAEQILLVAREKAVALGYLERLGGGS